MASIKNFKKEMSYVYGEIVNAVVIYEMTTTGKPTPESDALIEEVYAAYDSMLEKTNEKPENLKAHFKNVRKEFEDSANELVTKVNALQA